jgi:hypothetical protein
LAFANGFGIGAEIGATMTRKRQDHVAYDGLREVAKVAKRAYIDALAGCRQDFSSSAVIAAERRYRDVLVQLLPYEETKADNQQLVELSERLGALQAEFAAKGNDQHRRLS